MLYPDSTAYECNEILNTCKKYDHIYILHDKDIYTSEEAEEGKCNESQIGQLKKAHYHIYLYFDSPRSINSVCKLIGLPPNYIEWLGNQTKALRYLIHLDHPDKHPYDSSLVSGSDYLLTRFYKAIQNRTEEDIFVSMLDILQSFPNAVAVSTIAYTFAKEGYYSEFRRNFAMWNVLIKEHNGARYEK